MGPFYAYARSNLDGNNGRTWRYLMTFSSREDADEWWRIISTPPSPTAGIFKRISPQYYTFKQSNVADYILSQKFVEGKTFQDKMFFTLLNDRDSRVQSTFPQQDLTDHISRNWFYIRSKSDPHRFWYCSVGGIGECFICGLRECRDVHVSTERCSRFCIWASGLSRDDLQAQKVIMIRSDRITIAPSKEYILHITDNNQLKAKKSTVIPDFVFSDLKDRFSVQVEGPKFEGRPDVEYVVPVDRGTGDAWELVA